MSNNNELKNLCENLAEIPLEQPTFKTVCREWIKRKRIYCAISTIHSYELKLNKYLHKVPFVDKPIDTIQREEIEQWVFELRKTCTEKCILGTLGVLNNIINYAIKMRWVDHDLPTMIKLLEPIVKLSETFTIDEIENLLDNIDPFYQDYQEIMFSTGKRSTVMNALKWSDINLKERPILIGRYRAIGKSLYYKKCRTQLMNERVFKAVSSHWR